jgi:hypothetical protein
LFLYLEFFFSFSSYFLSSVCLVHCVLVHHLSLQISLVLLFFFSFSFSFFFLGFVSFTIVS